MVRWYSRKIWLALLFWSCCRNYFIPILNVKIRFGDCGRSSFWVTSAKIEYSCTSGTSVRPIDVPSPFDVIYGQGLSAELLVLTRYTNSLNSSNNSSVQKHIQKKNLPKEKRKQEKSGKYIHLLNYLKKEPSIHIPKKEIEMNKLNFKIPSSDNPCK